MSASAQATGRTALDQEKMQQFAAKMVGVLNAGALAVMTSLGHRTRLFDVLATLPASTSAEIAAAAGLAERYVREWLAAMVTGGVIEYDGTTDRYLLPREHAAFLTRAARPNNIAVNAQFVPLIARLEDRMLECFERGEGLPYEAYERFHEVMAEASDQSVVAKLFDQILPLVPGLVERLEGGIDVLDIGCGAGRAICALAERFPASRFMGIDLCRDAIAMANDEANRRRLANVSFRRANFSALEARPRYDLITTFDAIHDHPDPQLLIETIGRLLRADGVYLLQEPHGTSKLDDDRSLPVATFLYAISTMHCTAVSLGQGGAGPGTLWGEERLRALLDKAGFRRVAKHVLQKDLVGMFLVARLG